MDCLIDEETEETVCLKLNKETHTKCMNIRGKRGGNIEKFSDRGEMVFFMVKSVFHFRL